MFMFKNLLQYLVEMANADAVVANPDAVLKYPHLRRAMNQAVEKSLQDFNVNDFLISLL